MSSFAITKCARKAARRSGAVICALEKAIANRRAKHRVNQELRAHGQDADPIFRRYVGWDVT